MLLSVRGTGFSSIIVYPFLKMRSLTLFSFGYLQEWLALGQLSISNVRMVDNLVQMKNKERLEEDVDFHTRK